MDTWVQPTLFPLPPARYYRPVPQAPSIPKQMTYEEWMKRNGKDISSRVLTYTEYIHILHTEQILWERWCGNARQ